MTRPVAFHMGNDALATAMQTRVISYADPRAGRVEVMESCRQWGQAGPGLDAGLDAGLFSWRGCEFCIRFGVGVLYQGH
jgi:hypothetical protein